MITEQDLQAAIAECKGQRNPTANTCIKLAAFYTIKNELFPEQSEPIRQSGYSYSSGTYEGSSEFAKLVNGKSEKEVYKLLMN